MNLKSFKTFIYKSVNNSVTHYSSISSLPLLMEGEHIYYDGNEILPEEIERSIEIDYSNYSVIRNWNKFWKTVNITSLVNENTR